MQCIIDTFNGVCHIKQLVLTTLKPGNVPMLPGINNFFHTYREACVIQSYSCKMKSKVLKCGVYFTIRIATHLVDWSQHYSRGTPCIRTAPSKSTFPGVAPPSLAESLTRRSTGSTIVSRIVRSRKGSNPRFNDRGCH